MNETDVTIRPCPHCRGTGLCKTCHGTGELPLQRGKKCTSCFPKGSGMCQNCRGLGGRDNRGHPAAYGRAAAVVAAEVAAQQQTAPESTAPSIQEPVQPIIPAAMTATATPSKSSVPEKPVSTDLSAEPAEEPGGVKAAKPAEAAKPTKVSADAKSAVAVPAKRAASKKPAAGKQASVAKAAAAKLSGRATASSTRKKSR